VCVAPREGKSEAQDIDMLALHIDLGQSGASEAMLWRKPGAVTSDKSSLGAALAPSQNKEASTRTCYQKDFLGFPCVVRLQSLHMRRVLLPSPT
jgi:hypothetical protein